MDKCIITVLVDCPLNPLNMTYPFPDISNTPFKVTFLKDVSIGLRYMAPELSESVMNQLEKFGQDTFGLELFSQWDKKPVYVRTDDSQVMLTFSSEEVKLKLRFPRYKKFADILEEMTPVYEFFRILGINTVVECAITKYNELLYHLSKDSMGVSGVMMKVFTPDLYNHANNFAQDLRSFNDVTRWEKKISFNPVSDEEVSMVYGFAQDEEDSLKGVLILKPSVLNKAIVPLDSLKEELQRLNAIVNRAFQWAVSSELIKKLQGRDE